jgi:Cu/Ag efflux pump CusA
MRDFLGSILRFRILVVAAAAATMIFGLAELRKMPIDVLPEFAPPLVEVQTEALGLSANEVENLITLNLEELLSGVPWLQTIRSRSVPGVSSVLLIFEPGTDVMRARQLVQERLTLAYTLPNVSKAPQMIQPLSTTSRTMMVGLSSDELSLMELSVLARWTIKPKLLGVPGVANVAVWGDRDRQLQVLIDPERLRDRGVTQDQIISTAGNALWISPLSFLQASVPGTGGWIDSPNQRLEVRHVLPISSPEDLAQVTVEGTSLRLGDVADVVEGYPPLIGDALLNDGPGLVAVIEKLPGANTLEVTRGVEAALEALRPGMSGVEMDATVFRSASFIETAFRNLRFAVLVGAVLMVLVLGAMLYNWRAAVVAIVTVPLSLVAALVVMRDLTFNTMILVGLVIALVAVVDDAIVSVESIVRRLRQQGTDGSEQSRKSVIVETTLEMRGPMLNATLIIVLAALPIFLIEGLAGAFLRPLALSLTMGLAAAMLVALVVTPSLGLMLLKHGPDGGGESNACSTGRLASRARRSPRSSSSPWPWWELRRSSGSRSFRRSKKRICWSTGLAHRERHTRRWSGSWTWPRVNCVAFQASTKCIATWGAR